MYRGMGHVHTYLHVHVRIYQSKVLYTHIAAICWFRELAFGHLNVKARADVNQSALEVPMFTRPSPYIYFHILH